MTKERLSFILNAAVDLVRKRESGGICFANSLLRIRGTISQIENFLIDKIILKNRPEKMWDNSTFFFEPYAVEPRQKFVNKIIEEYKETGK